MIAGRGAGYALLAAGALLAVVAGCSAWRGATSLRSGQDARPAVAGAARAFVERLGTYGAGDEHSYLSRLAALSGGELRPALEAARLDPSAAGGRAVLETRVDAVSIDSLDDGAATVRVIATQARSAPNGGEAAATTHLRQRLELELARQRGRWLVTALRVIDQVPVGVAGGQ